MAAFDELDWRRFDVWALVERNGIATIDEDRSDACRDWLRGNGYEVVSLDLGCGISQAVQRLGSILQWERQFGYSLRPDSRNLDALHDGFDFAIPVEGGTVLELVGAEVAWQEDERWTRGLLAIAEESSRRQLALGRRFFTLLPLPEHSPLIGQAIAQSTVPALFQSRSFGFRTRTE